MKKNKLIIKVHPSKNGFTHKIVEEFVEGAKSVGHKTEVIDLYSKKYFIENLKFEDKRNIEKSKLVELIQKKISKADEIILVFPIWWSDSPAVLKNFFDVVFSVGFAFKYENGKSVKLLDGKVARMFMTCDGSSFGYKLILRPIWSIARFGFCGVKLKSFIILDRMFKQNDDSKKSFLKRINFISKL